MILAERVLITIGRWLAEFLPVTGDWGRGREHN
jgi:hypothetical protein